MSNSTLDATIFVHPDTEITTRVWRDAKVGVIAVLRWDGLTIHFAPDQNGAGLAQACDVLADAVASLRAEVAPETDPEADRDDRIDAGLGTGYVGEFVR